VGPLPLDKTVPVKNQSNYFIFLNVE
jgi:hypothetical protein